MQIMTYWVFRTKHEKKIFCPVMRQNPSEAIGKIINDRTPSENRAAEAGLPRTPVTHNYPRRRDKVVRGKNRMWAGVTTGQREKNRPRERESWEALPTSGLDHSAPVPCHGGARWRRLMDCVDEWVTKQTGGVIWFNKTDFENSIALLSQLLCYLYNFIPWSVEISIIGCTLFL